MELPERVLFRAWEISLDEYHHTMRKQDEPSNTYIARLWVHGILQALKLAGYSVCISKDGKEVWSSKPS